MDKKKLLITGVSGLLGSNIAVSLRDHYHISGIYNSNPIEIPEVDTRHVNILDKEQVSCVIQEINPDIVLHCAAQADVDICENNKDLAECVNVQGTEHILQALESSQAKYIYISTDLVYEGMKGNYSEEDKACPLNHYGVTKLKAEEISLKRENALILRTNFFGWNVRGKRSLGEWVIDELLKRNAINGFDDVYFSSIYTFELARILDEAIKQNIQGIYNLGSSTSISKYVFAKMIAEKLSLDTKLITPISIDDATLKAKRAKNLSFNVDKISQALKIIIPTIEDSIDYFAHDYRDGFSQKFKFYVKTQDSYPHLDVIPYGRQNIVQEDIDAVVDVLKSHNLTQGPKIDEFESKLAYEVGARYAVAVNSGTSALHIACLAAGIREGDEVITSPNTFVASANCAAYCGATPIFADIDARTYNLSPEEMEKKITKNTRAIIPVHFAGQSCAMDEIKKVVSAAEKKYGKKIFIIEDASHALGSQYKGAKVGACQHSDMAVFSFHPVKHITTAEGGAVLTNDSRLCSELKSFRSHGIAGVCDESESKFKKGWLYEQQNLGYNYRTTDLQCALGISQLKRLDQLIQRRREIVNFYNEQFEKIETIRIPFESKDCNSNFHLYVLLFDFEAIGVSREELMYKLRERKILTQVHYIPVHTQPYYQKHYGTQWGDYPHAENYYQRCLSLPLFFMQEKQEEVVVDEVVQLIGKN